MLFACCGHGDSTLDRETGTKYNGCYVVFDDGLTLYGRAARAAMEMLGGSPPPIPYSVTARTPSIVVGRP